MPVMSDQFAGVRRCGSVRRGASPSISLRVRQRGARQPLAAEHAGDFGARAARRRAAPRCFRCAASPVARRCCLATTRWWSAQAATCGRWVTASTWRSRPSCFISRPDRLGHRAADAGIDLVEDQRLRRAELAGGDGDRQRDARQLAARRHLADRPRRAARDGRDQEADFFQAARRRLRQRLQRHLEAAALHAQALHRLRDGLAPAAARPCVRALASAARLRQVGLLRRLLGALRAQPGRAAASSARKFVLPAGQQRRQLGRRALVAARQRHPQAHALVEFGQPLRVGFGLAQVGVQRMRGVLGLGQARGQHLGQRL